MVWKEYETITKYIYETLGKEYGVMIEGHGHTCKVKGRSGNGAIHYTKLNITHSIKGITLLGRLLILPGPRFHPVDEIWLIMKNIFEDTTHTISRLGRIQKD